METALIAIVNRLLENQDSSHANGMIFADFQKAFDLVDHSVLINATQLSLHHHIFQDLNGLQMSMGKYPHFNSCRTQCPQGSVLAPLLFFVFINDLPVGVTGQSTTVDIFADDTSMSSSTPISDFDTSRS